MKAAHPIDPGDSNNSISGELLDVEDLSLLVCHELRTPLTAIKGVLGLLHCGHLNPDSAEGQQLLGTALDNINRLVRLASSIERHPSVYSNVLPLEAIERFRLIADLRSALDREELSLLYQPIVSLTNKRICGFEALVRWTHPTKGLISPTTFIPLAEEAGLIHQIGIWVLEQSCKSLKALQVQLGDESLSMHVNLSVLQLLRADLAPKVRQVLEETRLPASCLKLEITESALIENYALASAVLADLEALGVLFNIDDFGTGYSSLSRLQDLPISALKIDRSFIKSKRWTTVRGVMLLANTLGLEVIAEGVETLEELETIRKLGCDRVQGYFFSPPVDEKATAALMTSPLAA